MSPSRPPSMPFLTRVTRASRVVPGKLEVLWRRPERRFEGGLAGVGVAEEGDAADVGAAFFRRGAGVCGIAPGGVGIGGRNVLGLFALADGEIGVRLVGHGRTPS